MRLVYGQSDAAAVESTEHPSLDFRLSNDAREKFKRFLNETSNFNLKFHYNSIVVPFHVNDAIES